MLSYDSSPAFTVDKKTGKSTTEALLDTCTRQVEYAGVLAGAEERARRPGGRRLPAQPRGAGGAARQHVRLPGRDGVTLPAEWAKFATQPTTPSTSTRPTIDANRNEWLTEWTDITSR